jgi:DNA-binding transcriptional LysR family regulator
MKLSPHDNLTWDDLRVLLAVHRNKSLKAAGASLQLSTSTTARRIDALEAAVGRSLVVRTSRGASVDPGALDLVELATSLELGLRAALRGDPQLGSVVRISTGDGFAGPLVQVLADLRRRSPETRIELVSEAHLVDVSRRETDLAIRTSRTHSSVVVERPLGSLTFGLYASRDYVERWVRSSSLQKVDFERLNFVGFVGPLEKLPHAKWLALLQAKRFCFRANTDALVHEAIRQSQGIGVLAELVGDADASLQRLDVTPNAPTISVWLVFRRELRAEPRVRAVAQAIEASFRLKLQR